MKKYENKTVLFTLFVLFLLIGGVECEENTPRYEIYENHEISACGVDDPLNNLQWLKDQTQKLGKLKGLFTILLYENNINSENYFVESYTDSKIVEYSYQSIYNCKGNKIMTKGIEAPPSDEWKKFFKENKKIAEV